MVWGHLGAQSLGVGIIYPFRWRFKGGGYHSVGRNSLTPSHASSMVSAGVGLSLSLYIYIFISLSLSCSPALFLSLKERPKAMTEKQCESALFR